MEFIIYDGDGATLRDFPPESLTPPVDILGASAAARKGERQIDPLAALVRNVLAIDRPRSNVRRLGSRGLKLPAIPPEIHAEYQAAFAARVSHYRQAGKTEVEARALALDDLGCEQFFAHLQEQTHIALPVSATSVAPIDTRSEVERARIRAANVAKLTRLRKQWAKEQARRKGEAA
jgi:hypothetical protein